MSSGRIFALLVALIALQMTSLHAQETPDPAAHFARVMANRNLAVEGQVTGEGFCWHAAYAADSFVDGYQTHGDGAWLDGAARYFDWLVSLMAVGPDGYRGFIGPYIYDTQYWADVHVGDAILINPMLRFAEVVLGDQSLEAVHGARARRYIALAERDLMEKWDARGTWHDDGPQGAYASWDRYLLPDDLSTWRNLPGDKSGLSLPFNKQMDMGVAALRLFRLTGNAAHRVRAEKIFALFRARLRLFEGGYVWNYWEPLGPWDIDLDQQRIRHWVNVHPTRNYQSREVASIVEAYHTGIVFTRQDIERIIHTNIENMWNGDRDKPRWRNAGLGGLWTPQPEGRAGTLWTALGDFDARVRQLGGHSETSRNAPSFVRRYAVDGPTAQTEPMPSPHLTMAAALPRVSGPSAPVLLACKAARDGALRVDICSGDGTVVEHLYDGPIAGSDDGLEGLFWLQWNDANLPAGTYIVRWTLDDEHREYTVEKRP